MCYQEEHFIFGKGNSMNFIVAFFPLWALGASIIVLFFPPLLPGFPDNHWIRSYHARHGHYPPVGRLSPGFPHARQSAHGSGITVYDHAFLCWSLGYAFDLCKKFAVGLSLVANCPGGTASNVICYIGKLDVALSVTMTSVSTLIAVVMHRFSLLFLVGSRLHVDTLGLFVSIIQVIIFPIVVGLLLRRFFPKTTQKIIKMMPVIAVLFITLIVASIIGAGKKEILQAGLKLLCAVFTLHSFGFLLGLLTIQAYQPGRHGSKNYFHRGRDAKLRLRDSAGPTEFCQPPGGCP